MLPLDQVSDRQAQAVHDGTIWRVAGRVAE